MRKVSRSEDSINNNIKEVMAKEAGIADIPHNIVTHLPTLIPTVAAEAGLLTGLVKNIKNRNKTAPNPTPGTDEAYNATGFMSPSQIQDYKNKDAVEKNSSFDERYANEKTEASFRAMMQSKHGNVLFDDSDWRNDYSDLDSDW